MSARGRFSSWVVVGYMVSALCAGRALADPPTTKAPFIYETSKFGDSSEDPDFLARFDDAAPELLHLRSVFRFLGRYGVGGRVLDAHTEDYEEFLRETRLFTNSLHDKGVRWITPYLCNQTLSGNDVERTGAWEAYDRWDEFDLLGLGPKPPEPLTWMQREASGNLHYNYRRMCYLGRGDAAQEIRYAPCPNNPHWRRLCNAEARLAAEAGFDGLFIDNCILHCYCDSCQQHFQAYLRRKYTPERLEAAFGTKDYAQITLSAEGDIRTWAKTFDGFIPWLKAKYPPEERRVHFDTDGALTSQHVDNAGCGMLGGEAAAFIREHVLPAGQEPTFEAIRLCNPVLQTPEGRLLWAETTLFWAYSIGDMLAETRDAGREVHPNFFLTPNWGSMQRVNGAAGRAEEAKNLSRWIRGAGQFMYEEELTTGMIAPGLVLDYDMELRFAFANGMRAVLLPHNLLAGRDVAEVVLAETAASGGGVLVGWNAYPELWQEYQTFFRENVELYEGYQSGAKVGLVHCFDQVHFLNVEHLRHVHALNRFLAEQHIPFDHVVERDLTAEGLTRYRVLILPNVVFMSDAECAAVRAFINGGGVVIAVGACATHDRYCRHRATSPFAGADSDGGVVRFDTLSDALPHKGLFLEPIIQAAGGQVRGETPEERRTSKYRYMAKVDRESGVKRYVRPGPLVAEIAKALGHSPSLIDPTRGGGLRTHVYVRDGEETARMVVHLVNKSVPLTVAEEDRRLTPAEDVTLRVPVPESWRVLSAAKHAPGETPAALSLDQEPDGTCVAVITRLDAYALVAIECAVP